MFCFVFSKQNNESFQIFPGSIRGTRTCLLAGSGGRSPTAMLIELGAKPAFLHIALDLLNPLRKQQIRRAASNFVYQFVIENASASVNRLDPWRRNGKRDTRWSQRCAHCEALTDCPFGQQNTDLIVSRNACTRLTAGTIDVFAILHGALYDRFLGCNGRRCSLLLPDLPLFFPLYPSMQIFRRLWT